MSSKITAIPIVDFGASSPRKSTWVESVNPAFSRKSLGIGSNVLARGGRTCWQRNRKIIVASIVSVAIVVAVAAGVGISRTVGQSSSSVAAAGAGGTGLAGGEASAAPTPMAAPSLVAPSPGIAAASATPSGSASAAASVAPTTSASITASPSPSPTALPLPSAIAVSTNASAVELWSARMLSERLGFPLTYVRPGTAPAAQAVIAVGYGAAVRYGLGPQLLDGLGKDAFLLSNRRERGLLAGSLVVSSGPASSARGTVYGAYRLLRQLGFGFYGVGVNATRVPAKPFALPTSGVDILEQPPLLLRDMSSGTVQDNRLRIRGPNNTWTFPPVNLSAALGFNGVNVNLPVGGFEGVGMDPPGFVHTSISLLNPDFARDPAAVALSNPQFIVCFNATQFDTWPCNNATLASMAYNVQPCWAEPSMQAYMTQSIRKVMQARPSTRIVEIDVMDGGPPVCSLDNYWNKLENVTGGANFHAVNNIAATLSTEFPELSLQTIAYNNAQAPPPFMRMRDNVMIRYVPGGMDQFASLYDPVNAKVLSEARIWLSKANIVTVWDNYDSFRFTIAPWPNYFWLPKHVIEFAQLGFKGYYASGIPLAGPDMADLKTYLTAAAMWDPYNVNLTSAAEEYANFVYGTPQAAQGVLGYIYTLEASFKENDKTLDYKGYKNVRGAARRITLWNAVYSNRTLVTCGRLLKDAEAAAPSKWHKDNVRQAMMSLQYVVLLRWGQLRLWASTASVAWPFAPTAAEEFGLFNATFVRTKVFYVQHMDEFPAITAYSCDLVCLRQLMLGY